MIFENKEAYGTLQEVGGSLTLRQWSDERCFSSIRTGRRRVRARLCARATAPLSAKHESHPLRCNRLLEIVYLPYYGVGSRLGVGVLHS